MIAIEQLTDAVLAGILQALAAGNDRESSARFAGVDPAVFAAAVEADPALREKVLQAEASSDVASMSAVAAAARKGDWRAGAFMLERRTRVFDADRHCGAATNPLNGALPCTFAKGWGTDHVGIGNCRLHGGNTPNGRRSAARKAAENTLAKLKLNAGVDPIQSLFEAVSVAAWREQGLRMMVKGREALYGPDHQGDLREDVVAKMHAEALMDRARIAKMAVEAGLDERLVRIAEREASIVIAAIQAALDSAGITGEQRTEAEAAAAQVLEAIAPSGAELN